MDYNQYNTQFGQHVPPYPQPGMDIRNTNNVMSNVKEGPTSILDTKDSENSFVNSVLRTALNKNAKFYFWLRLQVRKRMANYYFYYSLILGLFVLTIQALSV